MAEYIEHYLATLSLGERLGAKNDTEDDKANAKFNERTSLCILHSDCLKIKHSYIQVGR